MTIPEVITDGVLLLRRPTMDDLPAMVEAVRESVPEISPWMGWCHEGYTEDEARSWLESLPAGWEQDHDYSFFITDVQTGLLLGGCGLNHIDRSWGLANLGYWVRTSQTRKGIASRATRLLALFGFEHLGVDRVEVVVAVGNEASLRAAKKAGAAREGVLRNRLHIEGVGVEAVMHSFIPSDFGF